MRIDAHCDTAGFLLKNSSLRNLPEAHWDYQRLQREMDIAFMAIFFHPQRYAGRAKAETLTLMEKLQKDIGDNADLVRSLFWREELQEADERTFLLCGLEGAEALEDDIDNLHLFFAQGLRFLGLTWNENNTLAGGAAGGGPLTAWGRQVIAECGELGILVDGAHLCKQSFWQVLEVLGDKRFIVSHTACGDCFKHRRNLSDEQLRALSKAGGVVGITFCRDFLADKASLDDYLHHLEHAIEIAGIDHVGIGSDFDGADLPDGFKGGEDMPLLWQALQKRGFSDEDIAKIAGRNFLKVLQEVLPQKTK